MSLDLRASDAEAILAASSQILVDERLVESFAEDALAGLAITVFDAKGVLSRATSRKDDAVLAIDAVPHGVLAIVGTKADSAPAEKLLGIFAQEDADPMPVLVSVDGEGETATLSARILAALAPCLASRLRSISTLYANREAELAAARRKAEWQSLSLRLGREMVAALGYGARSLAYEVEPGAGRIGPSGTVPCSGFVSRLPVDLAGLCAVSLHVAGAAASGTGEGMGAGRLVVTVGGPDLRHSIIRVEIPYEDLTPGWHDIVFPKPIGACHGDGVLTVAFVGEPAPVLSISERRTDRFGLVGDGEGRSPALRVWKGFAPDLFAAQAPSPLRIAGQRLSLSEADFLFGAAEEALYRQQTGDGPLAASAQGGLRIATRQDAPTGAILSGALPVGTVAVRVRAEATALRNPVAVPAAVASLRTPLRQRAGALLSSILPQGLPQGRGADPAAPAQEETRRMVALAVLSPSHVELASLRQDGEAILARGDAHERRSIIRRRLPDAGPASLRLSFDPPLTEPKSLAVLYGSQSEAGETIHLDDLVIEFAETQALDQPPVFGRRIPFPELKSRTGYLLGAGEAVRLSQAAGLPVMQVSDVESHMETHALQDHVTGARVAGLLGSGLVGVRAVVETAHPQGPEVEYGLFAVVPGAGLDDPRSFAKAFETYLQGGLVAKPSFVIAGAVARLAPGAPGMVRLDLDEPLSGAADLVCCVRSLSGHTNYAWCRWHALDVVMATAPGVRHDALQVT